MSYDFESTQEYAHQDYEEIEVEICECQFCFERCECSTFPVFVNPDGETVWMNGCDDCIARTNSDYARALGINIDVSDEDMVQ